MPLCSLDRNYKYKCDAKKKIVVAGIAQHIKFANVIVSQKPEEVEQLIKQLAANIDETLILHKNRKEKIKTYREVPTRVVILNFSVAPNIVQEMRNYCEALKKRENGKTDSYFLAHWLIEYINNGMKWKEPEADKDKWNSMKNDRESWKKALIDEWENYSPKLIIVLL